ncbi:MAG: acyl-CoA dehydrogenase family protein [Acidimicrobiales bacterium]
MSERVAIDSDTSPEQAAAIARHWVDANVPNHWREAALRGGPPEIRRVRPRSEYEAWYPVFAGSGLVVPTWPSEYGGLGVTNRVARSVEAELAPFNLGRLNVLGLNLAAPALFAFGTEEQRARYLPPIVEAREIWCQLFSEPGAGSDLASLATRAARDGDEWVVTGQKVWSTWAHLADYGVLLARTDPGKPKREGITYFLLELHQPGVVVRPLRQLTGDAEFNEVFLEEARVPDFQRLGDLNDGWRVARATLGGERQMISGPGSGGVDRIGGSGVARLIATARARSAAGLPGGWQDPAARQRLTRLYAEDRIRSWTNARVRDNSRANRPPGPESSVGKLASAELNVRIQEAWMSVLGGEAQAWRATWTRVEGDIGGDAADPAFASRGFLRSRANTIEGGTSEVNRNILAERVLGLPREPDPWEGAPWRDLPRSAGAQR